MLGHVAALILAHDRALALYENPKLAVRSQYWMPAVMVGFTTLALWLLAQAGTWPSVSRSAPWPAAGPRGARAPAGPTAATPSARDRRAAGRS